MDLLKIITDEVSKQVKIDERVICDIIHNEIIAHKLINAEDIKAFIAGNKPAETIIKFKPLDIPQLSNELVVKSQHKNYPLLLSCLTRPDAIYLYGPTGSGKTVAVINAANQMQLQSYRKVVSRETMIYEIIGYTDANGKYVPGIAYEPYKNGGLLFIDEIDNGNANTNVALKMLNDGDVCHFPSIGNINKHPNFRLVAGANTIGNGADAQYVGRNPQDKALLNIFVYLHWPYDEEFEHNIAWNEYCRYGGKDKNDFDLTVKSIVDIRAAIDELSINHIISPRNTLQAIRMLASGVDKNFLVCSVLLRGLEVSQVDKLKARVKLGFNKQSEITSTEDFNPWKTS